MEISTTRLRQMGLVILLISALAILINSIFKVAIDPPKIVNTLLIIGVGLMVVAEIGPVIKSFKLGGIEIQLIESVGGTFNALQARVGDIELALRRLQTATNIDLASASMAPAPGLLRPRVHQYDQNKGRFGGLAERDGFRLYVEFGTQAENWVQLKLSVKADPGLTLDPQDSVEFFLHETFKPDRVRVPFVKDRARLRVYAIGGFTVGAWIAGHGIELELDLATIPGAPRIIRQL